MQASTESTLRLRQAAAPVADQARAVETARQARPALGAASAGETAAPPRQQPVVYILALAAVAGALLPQALRQPQAQPPLVAQVVEAVAGLPQAIPLV